MCMALERRLQILLDEERYRRVAEAAREQRISVAAVIRDAIDQSLVPVDRRRQGAARIILDAPEMEVPTDDDLLRELDDMRARE